MLNLYRALINLILIFSPLIVIIRLIKKKESFSRFVEKYILFCLKNKNFILILNKKLFKYFLRKELNPFIFFLKINPVIGPRCVLGGKKINKIVFHKGKKFK